MAGELGVALMFGMGSFVMAYFSTQLNEEHIFFKIFLKITSLLALAVGFSLTSSLAESISVQVGDTAVVGYWLVLTVIYVTLIYWFFYLLIKMITSFRQKKEGGDYYEMEGF